MQRPLRTILVVVLGAVPLAIAPACTNDFDVFEGTSAEGGASSSSGGTSSSSSSSGSSSSSSSSSGSPGDASAIDAPDCRTTSGSCYTQEETCNTKCASDATTCSDKCSPGNQGRSCRRACDDAKTTCTNTCKTTCEQCAGPPCRAGCP